MEKQIKFILNKKEISYNSNPAKTLLDFIRFDENLKGTKEGCREGDCGACTVLIGELINDNIEYRSVNSCLFPMGNVNGKHVVTIEGLSEEGLSPIQQEFNNEGATQCGFCTPGFVNSLTGYIIKNKELNTHDAENAIAGNICRCTGYASIKRTAHNVVEKISSLNLNNNKRITALVENNILPNYFSTIEDRLKGIIENKDTTANSTTIIGGGTDLFVQRADSLLDENISFAKELGFNKIKISDNKCTIGSGVTIEQFSNSEIVNKYLPDLKKQLRLFASQPIRNSATIGGNLVNASPIGDSAIIFLALDAQLIIEGRNGERVIPLKKFYKGYKNLDMTKEEIIKEITFELPTKDDFYSFEKVSKRTHLDIASVNSALKISVTNGIINSAFLSAGGIAPIPLFLRETSNFFKEKELNSKTILHALEIAQSEISPISDIRGTTEYKRLLLNQLIKAHFIKLFPKQIDVEALI